MSEIVSFQELERKERLKLGEIIASVKRLISLLPQRPNVYGQWRESDGRAATFCPLQSTGMFSQSAAKFRVSLLVKLPRLRKMSESRATRLLL
jgi:hypothetical protein